MALRKPTEAEIQKILDMFVVTKKQLHLRMKPVSPVAARSLIKITEDGSIDAPDLIFEAFRNNRPHIAAIDGKLPCKFSRAWAIYLGIDIGIKNLIGFPTETQSISIEEDQLETLTGLPQSCRYIALKWHEHLPLLSVLLVKELEKFHMGYGRDPGKVAETIINRYIGQGRAGVMPCAAELHKAGYGGNARL